jgi:hypothetical protein
MTKELNGETASIGLADPWTLRLVERPANLLFLDNFRKAGNRRLTWGWDSPLTILLPPRQTKTPQP